MRLALIADIHGNLPALEAVLADARRQGVDGAVVAGDFSGGPRPLETVHALRNLPGWMIRGNREDYFLAFDTGQAPDAWWHTDQWASLRWEYEQLDREGLGLIASLPEQRVVEIDGVAPIRVVHGSLAHPSELILPEHDPAAMRLYKQGGLLDAGYRHAAIDGALTQIGEPVLVCGHSHIPWQQARDGRLVINPGAVGAPINGDPRAQYALLTWQGGRWQPEMRAIAYDLDLARAAYRDSGLLAIGGAMAHAFLRCVETGQNVPGRLVAHYRRFAARCGYEEFFEIPDTIWDQAVDAFDWQAAAAPRR